MDTILYGRGLMPYTVKWQGSTYLSQTYGEPLTFTQDFSSATNWWTPALEGATQPLAQYDQNIFIGDVEGLWIFRLFLDGNLVGTYTFANQSFTIPIRFDRVEAVAMGMPFSATGAFVTSTGSTPSLIPPTGNPPPMVPSAGISLTCFLTAIFALATIPNRRRSR
jgi:hypothetical protein